MFNLFDYIEEKKGLKALAFWVSFLVLGFICIIRLCGKSTYALFVKTALISMAFTWLVIPAIVVTKWMKERDENKKHNEKEHDRAALAHRENSSKEVQWQNTKKELTGSLTQILGLLKKGYSLNILPSQYRNLASVYYIYEYMSTSRATLEDTLLHEHMENGIQRILERLDTIIAQNDQRIFLDRQIQAQNQQIISNNRAMMASLERTEQNTREAAEYAAISANYAEVSAFFAAANYLRQK